MAFADMAFTDIAFADSEPQNDTHDLIASLPPELRNRVYDYAITHALETYERKTRKGKSTMCVRVYGIWNEPPLLKTCKQIRYEAASIFYKALELEIPPTYSLDSAKMLPYFNKIRSVVHWCGPQPFKKIEIYIKMGAWKRLGELLPLLELMRSSGFEPAVKKYEPQTETVPGRYEEKKIATTCSIFIMASFSYATLQNVLEQGIALGRTARDEDWTQEKLESEFATWKNKALSSRGQQSKTKRKKD